MPSKKEDVKKPSPKKLPPKKSSRRKKIKGGSRVYSVEPENESNIFIQETIDISKYTSGKFYTYIISEFLEHSASYSSILIAFLTTLNMHNTREDGSHIPGNFFDDIVKIVNEYKPDPPSKKNFQTKNYDNNNTLFGKYELWTKETPQRFITIDPTIIQIMIFDEPQNNKDIVHSLKLIIRQKNKLCLRYTTQLFPVFTIKTPIESKITKFNNLNEFANFNTKLDSADFNLYTKKLLRFINTYKNFYEFYKKCYKIDKCGPSKKLIDYQLKYISILGKARFRDIEIINRTAILTDYIMSNLIFTNPQVGFISGGYKGFKDNAYGITRSGYEIAKKYNRPILTIMCKEGLHDSHEYSDGILIYGEHWGEDTIALSQFTDGAVIIAPFGGWTYVECLALLENKKIVGIYNDLFNILNYKQMPDQEFINSETNEIMGYYEYDNLDNTAKSKKREEIKKEVTNKYINKSINKNFFKFTLSEQESILNYYINYYLILLYILNDYNDDNADKLKEYITYGIQILMHLKKLCEHSYIILNKLQQDFDELKNQFVYRIDTLNNMFKQSKSDRPNNVSAGDIQKTRMRLENTLKNIQKEYNEKNYLSDDVIKLIDSFNDLKESITEQINNDKMFSIINNRYKRIISSNGSNGSYQDDIPKNCDGIWIKPIFDLITDCIKDEAPNESIPSFDTPQLPTAELYVKGEVYIEDSVAGGSYGGQKSKKCKKGGTYNIDNATLHERVSKYKITISKLNSDFISKLNTNIIFVFSDIMYLNIYLNKNLNSDYIQNTIKTKINNLKDYSNIEFKERSRDLLVDSTSTKVVLNRSIDGIFDTDKNIISKYDIIKDNYIFNINKTCNDYTSYLEEDKGEDINSITMKTAPLLADIRTRFTEIDK